MVVAGKLEAPAGKSSIVIATSRPEFAAREQAGAAMAHHAQTTARNMDGGFMRAAPAEDDQQNRY
jgi:hypothetical protein